VYVTNFASKNVSVIDTANDKVVDTIDVGDSPSGIAITPDGSSAYVANLDSGDVSVIDTATNTVVGTPIVLGDPTGIAITPDGSSAYVTVESGIFEIDTATNMVVTPGGIEIGTGGICGIAITPSSQSSPPGESLPPPPGGGNNGSSTCSLAAPGASPSLPLYLLIPAFILINRFWRRRTN